MRTRRLAIVLLLFCAATLVIAQQRRAQRPQTNTPPPAAQQAAGQKLLTLDDVLDARKFAATPVVNVRWAKDGKHFLQSSAGDGGGRRGGGSGGGDLLLVDALTGESKPFYDAAKMEAALAKVPGISAGDARRLARRGGAFNFNPDQTAVLLNHANDLFYCELGSDRAVRLTYSPEEETQEGFSPDGKWVSFVRGNNLYTVDIASGHERQLTTDGGPQRLNGKFDWVYQEEVYGRGNFRGYWWSPDSARVAYLQFDETPVYNFTVVDHIPHLQEVEVTPYPYAGDPNPKVRLGIVPVVGGATRWVDDFAYQAADPIIARVGWTPDAKKVVYEVANREQTWLDLNLADPSDGKYKTLLRETTKAWVEPDTRPANDPRWLKDGSFLWESERSGFKHIYHYSAEGKLLRQVTEGKWEARQVLGVDEANGWLYFSSNEHSPIAEQIYRIKLDGTGFTRLSRSEGGHRASFNSACTHFVDTFSNSDTPTQTRLYNADGSEVRLIDQAKPAEALKEYKLGKVEFLQVKTRDGFPMEAMLIKPPDFDPGKKYPAMEFTYSGPHAPQVRNGYGYSDARAASTSLWYQFLATKGYLIWVCDNRTASGKGAVYTWQAYKHLGESELRDLEDGLKWLTSQPWVDAGRIGLHGWSYGGFMTSYALTHSKMWKLGIAGGSVEDWRLYDSIYTERYMDTPQHNPDGYRETSNLAAAKNLAGRLLLIHGAIDDNVHMQNTVQMVYELEKAGKQFELMIYPKSRHGVRDPQLSRHMRVLMTEYILKNL